MGRRIGYVPCDGTHGCGNPEMTVEETDNGTLSLKCHRCGASGFAKAGTRKKRNVLAVMVNEDDDEPAPSPAAPPAKPAPTPTPKPEPAPAAKKRTGLLLDN